MRRNPRPSERTLVVRRLIGITVAVGIATGIDLVTNHVPTYAAPVSTYAHAESLVACYPEDDSATDFKDYILKMVTGTDSIAANDRAGWELPAVDSSQVFFITDSMTCDRAARAHAVEARTDTLNPKAVHLLGVGPTRHIAFNYHRVGEWLMYFVFDSSFVLVAPMGS